jgi:tetratricopeptide (TPR) repeat protein
MWLTALLLFAPAPTGQTATSTDPVAVVAEAQRDEAEGKLEEARDLYERALLLRPRDTQAQAGMASSSERLSLKELAAGDKDDALADLVRAQRAEPDNQKVLYDLGILEDQMGLYLDSAATLDHLVALKPADPNAYYALGRVDLDLGKLGASETAMTTYLNAHPLDASAHYGLGRVYLEGLQFDKAQKEFEESIRIQPKQVETYYQLGQAFLQQDKYSDAMAQFQKALERDPAHGGALVGMGTAYFKLKQYPAAKDWLTKGVQAAPDYQLGHYYLGLTLAKTGDSEASKRELDLAATLAAKDNAKSASRLRIQNSGGPP